MDKSAKHLIKYLQEREAEGFPVGELIAKVQDGLKAARAQSTPIAAVTRRMVNGAEVIEVPH